MAAAALVRIESPVSQESQAQERTQGSSVPASVLSNTSSTSVWLLGQGNQSDKKRGQLGADVSERTKGGHVQVLTARIMPSTDFPVTLMETKT